MGNGHTQDDHLDVSSRYRVVSGDGRRAVEDANGPFWKVKTGDYSVQQEWHFKPGDKISEIPNSTSDSKFFDASPQLTGPDQNTHLRRGSI